MTVAFQAHAYPIAEEDAFWRRSYPVRAQTMPGHDGGADPREGTGATW